MDLLLYVRNEIEAALQRLRALEFAIGVDAAYVGSSESDPSDAEYFRCELELLTLEKEYLERRLTVLRQRLAAADPAQEGAADQAD